MCSVCNIQAMESQQIFIIAIGTLHPDAHEHHAPTHWEMLHCNLPITAIYPHTHGHAGFITAFISSKSNTPESLFSIFYLRYWYSSFTIRHVQQRNGWFGMAWVATTKLVSRKKMAIFLSSMIMIIQWASYIPPKICTQTTTDEKQLLARIVPWTITFIPCPYWLPQASP